MNSPSIAGAKMSDLFNILSNSNKDIDNQKLMDYLSGKLAGRDKDEFEQQIADNELLTDAVEGLQKIKDKSALQSYVNQLNQELHRHLESKKIRRETKKIREYPWIYLTIVLILIISIVGYLIIRRFLP